jgi:hypothetical protein
MQNINTWNVFSTSDVFMAFMAFLGFTAVTIVLRSAFRKVNDREMAFRGENREL